MPNSEDILIADELVAFLNGKAYSEPFTAERVYSADWNVDKELNALQLGVWPGESSAAPFERDLLGKTYRTGITFAKHLAAQAIAVLDGLMDLVKAVQEDLELTLVTIPDGRQYVNTGWDYVLRFNELSLDRNKGADGTVKYTGLFASILVFDFQSLE